MSYITGRRPKQKYRTVRSKKPRLEKGDYFVEYNNKYQRPYDVEVGYKPIKQAEYLGNRKVNYIYDQDDNGQWYPVKRYVSGYGAYLFGRAGARGRKSTRYSYGKGNVKDSIGYKTFMARSKEFKGFGDYFMHPTMRTDYQNYKKRKITGYGAYKMEASKDTNVKTVIHKHEYHRDPKPPAETNLETASDAARTFRDIVASGAMMVAAGAGVSYLAKVASDSTVASTVRGLAEALLYIKDVI